MSRKRIHTGIYCFQNLINGKRYIGQANNVERRLYEHEYHLLRGTDKCLALQNAVNKYRIENFEVSILESCEPELLNEREVFYINQFQSNNRKYGYNLSSGGDSGLIGYSPSQETRDKISKAKLEKHWKMSDKQKQQISNFNLGKVVSEETKAKMSKNNYRYWLGKKMPPETIEKLSASHGGKNAWQLGKKSPNASSQYIGVGKIVSKGHTYWSVNIKVYGERTHIGMSKDEIEAARLYDAYVIENNLPNPLNFPGEKK